MKKQKNKIQDKMANFLTALFSSHKRIPIKASWLKKRDFVKKCLSRFGDYLLDLPASMQLDEELVQIGLKNKPLLACQSPWSENKEWVKMAIQQNPHIVQHIKIVDFELAQFAVGISNGAFAHLFGKISLVQYFEIYEFLQLKNPHIYEYLNPVFKSNPEFIEHTLSKDLSCGAYVPLDYFEDHFEWVVKAWNFQHQWARHPKLQNRFPQRYVDLFRQKPDTIKSHATPVVEKHILKNDGMMIHYLNVFWEDDLLELAFQNQFNRKKFFNHGSIMHSSQAIWYKNKIPLPKSNPLFLKLSVVEPSLSKFEYHCGICVFQLCRHNNYSQLVDFISENPFLSLNQVQSFCEWCIDRVICQNIIEKPWSEVYSSWVNVFSPHLTWKEFSTLPMISHFLKVIPFENLKKFYDIFQTKKFKTPDLVFNWKIRIFRTDIKICQ